MIWAEVVVRTEEKATGGIEVSVRMEETATTGREAIILIEETTIITMEVDILAAPSIGGSETSGMRDRQLGSIRNVTASRLFTLGKVLILLARPGLVSQQ